MPPVAGPDDKHFIHLNSFTLTTAPGGGDYSYLQLTGEDKDVWSWHLFRLVKAYAGPVVKSF